MSMKPIQQALANLGFNPGKIDGYGGPKTQAALEAFLRQNDMPLRVDVMTRDEVTLSGPANLREEDLTEGLPWMDAAFSVMGLHETRNNETLRRFLISDGSTVGDPAQIPWCGDFVQTCIKRALPDEPFTGRVAQNPYLAYNWKDFGTPCVPCVGAVMDFWRGSPASIYGHVGFYLSEDATHYHIVGGNQSNKVSVTKIAKNRLRAVRWPVSSTSQPGRRVLRDEPELIQTINEA